MKPASPETSGDERDDALFLKELEAQDSSSDELVNEDEPNDTWDLQVEVGTYVLEKFANKKEIGSSLCWYSDRSSQQRRLLDCIFYQDDKRQSTYLHQGAEGRHRGCRR